MQLQIEVKKYNFIVKFVVATCLKFGAPCAVGRFMVGWLAGLAGWLVWLEKGDKTRPDERLLID